VNTSVFRPLQDQGQLRAWRRRVFGDDVPFVVYVGKPTRRRNLPNLLRAFHLLKKTRSIPHKLLLIGTALPGTSFAAIVDELGLSSEVVSMPHASHDEIALAYNASTLNIYPSDYEGFGMPVLEAMACGTPVIALDNTAIPEFAGGIAMLLADAQVETLAGGMWDLMMDDARRAMMKREGPRRAQRYEWKVIALQYMELLRSLADKSRTP
jgi:glycosyltransferase involved in cell wall biosynthesis